MRQQIDAVQAEKAGSSLEGMHGPKNFIQQIEIVRRLFQLKQIGLDGFQVFLGFDDKIRDKFRIEKILAHTSHLSRRPEAMREL